MFTNFSIQYPFQECSRIKTKFKRILNVYGPKSLAKRFVILNWKIFWLCSMNSRINLSLAISFNLNFVLYSFLQKNFYRKDLIKMFVKVTYLN